MAKYPRKLCVLFVFMSLLVSCASSPSDSYSEAPASGESFSRSASGAPPASGESSSRLSEDADDNRMVTYSVLLRLFVKKPEDTRRTLAEQVKNNNGYIVRETDEYITTRIPAENMDTFLSSARTLGKIQFETKTGTDITDQYRDNVIRLDSLRTVRTRYLALLEKANSVSDILSIERELERINTEIELLEGKIKYAELSVAYSNITVGFRERVRPGIVGWIFYGLYHGIKWLFVWD